MKTTNDLLDRPLYGFSDVDYLLSLKPGTSRRWIDGYTRAGRLYDPVIREKPTAEPLVTWGEFVETRLLYEYRNAGVPVLRMRPAVVALRTAFQTQYPLASARPFLAVEGRELVMRVQREVELDDALSLVVVRNQQLTLSLRVEEFLQSVTFDEGDLPLRMTPVTAIPDVVIDPHRQFGEPSVRGVPTEVVAEQVRAGEPIAAIAEIYELTVAQVESAVRYELIRGHRDSDAA